MTTSRKQDNYKQTAVRLPADLHKAVHDAAEREERTFNGQVIATLRAALMQRSESTAQEGAAQ